MVYLVLECECFSYVCAYVCVCTHIRLCVCSLYIRAGMAQLGGNVSLECTLVGDFADVCAMKAKGDALFERGNFVGVSRL